MKQIRGQAILFIILLALALRVIFLNARGLWYDEAFAILFASRSFAEMLAGTLTPVAGAAADVHPLFYYFALHLWMQFAGDSVFVARFYSVVFGVATVPIVFVLAHALFNRQVGIIAALIVAIAPFHLAYSQEARMYAQLGFWSALAFFAFVRYRRAEQRLWWLVSVGAGACALYSHNLAFISFGALGIWTLAEAMWTKTWRFFWATLFAGLAMLMLWLPWLMFVPSQFGKIEQAYWVPVPTLVTLLQSLLVFTFDFDNAIVPAFFLPLLLFGALVLPLLLAVETRRGGETESRVSIWFTLTMAILPVALLFGISQWRPVYITRALLPAFLWYAIAIAWMFAGLPVLPRRLLAAAFGALILAILPTYYTYAQFPRSPFRAADQFLRTQIQPGDVVVHDNKMSFFPMYYYDRALEQIFLPDPVGAGSDTLALPTQHALQLFATPFEKAIAGKTRVWFVIFQVAIDQANDAGQSQGNLARLDQVMKRDATTAIGDLRIIEYETR